jgi:hypothetical protein
MKVGDHVWFKQASKAWKSRGLDPKEQGTVVDLYRAPMTGQLRIDVQFGSTGPTELAIPIEEMERGQDASGPGPLVNDSRAVPRRASARKDVAQRAVSCCHRAEPGKGQLSKKSIVDNEEPVRQLAKKVMLENPGLTGAELLEKFEVFLKMSAKPYSPLWPNTFGGPTTLRGEQNDPCPMPRRATPHRDETV